MMSGLNGFDTLRILRDLETDRTVPMIMLTGLDDVDSIQRAYDAGATDFIIKPFKPAILANRARHIFRASRAHQVAETRRIAAAEAERATVAKSAFLANMSHELRTPLNAILGYAEMLVEGGTGADDAQRIHTAGSMLLALVNDILDLSRIEADRMPVVVERVPWFRIEGRVLMTIAPLAEKAANTLACEVDPTLRDVETDEQKLGQILINLCANANKFTAGGTVTLRLQITRPGWLRLSVTDNGPGIAPDQLERMFEPFAQATDTAQRGKGGTGLGLTISRHLCRLLGGELTATSAVGVGSTFSVELPIVPTNG